ncbi:MAG: hypothetical protein JJE17_00510 [Peptostreptococcaceae bacterium]|nr:hypothetical protein [Peptostreptococcaceae bacterium]
MSQKKYDSTELKEMRKTWSNINEDALDADNLRIFRARKQAVDLYIDDKTLKKIETATGIKYSTITKYVEKCLLVKSDGCMFGYSGLIPYIRTKNYERKHFQDDPTGNFSGSFEKLMKDYPDISLEIINIYTGKKSLKGDKCISIKNLHKRLLKLLKAEGFKETKYPFNTKTKGIASLKPFLDRNSYEIIDHEIKRYGENASNHHFSTGDGNIISPIPKRPFSRIQIDGHKIDAFFVINFIDSNGDNRRVIVKRLWLIAAIDVGTRAIIGYSISINEEYNRFDVLECIDNSIVPHELMEFTIKGLKYPEGGGFPSMLIPETKWALMDEILLDNAMSHLSKDVTNSTTRLGCTLNYGPVATPVRRSVIERFFRTLEENGFHRIPSTTGSNINDIKREGAEKDALAYNITLDHLLEITEIVISEYNNTPHSGNDYFTPIELMQQRIERGLIPSYVPVSKRNDFSAMAIFETRPIRGNKKNGKRPYINLNYFVYTSKKLCDLYSLVGKHLTLEINPKDIRVIKAYYADGSAFGDLHVTGKIRDTALSLKNLMYINKHMNTIKYRRTETSDIIGDYNDSLTKTALKNKSHALKKVSLEHDAQKMSPNSPILSANKPKESKRLDFNIDSKSLLLESELELLWGNLKK